MPRRTWALVLWATVVLWHAGGWHELVEETPLSRGMSADHLEWGADAYDLPGLTTEEVAMIRKQQR